MKYFNSVSEEQLWNERTTGQLKIVEQEFFRNGNLFLKDNPNLKDEIENILNGPITNQKFKSKTKDDKIAVRLGATALNTGIRKRLKNSTLEFKYEVTFDEGVFYDSNGTKGFDFALIDEKYNVGNFRNLCFGRRAIVDGEKLWTEEMKKKKSWAATNIQIDEVNRGRDLKYKKEKPTILGEIQFGNWALLYRDVLKVIKIEQEEDVNLFIYITAAGNLEKYISDSTVNYKSAKKVFEENKGILSMPIWLIGVDIE